MLRPVDEKSFIGKATSEHGSKGVSGEVSTVFHFLSLGILHLVAMEVVVAIRLEHRSELLSEFIHGEEVDFNIEGVAVVVVKFCHDTRTRLATVALLLLVSGAQIRVMHLQSSQGPSRQGGS